MPNHIPIHPRFAPKVFMQQQQPQPQQPSPQDIPSAAHFGGNVEADDFDIFEVPAEKPKEEEPKKKPYDKMIIIMAVVIIVLIAVVIWLMLSNNDDANDRSVNPSQFMGYPPGARIPPPSQFMQMPPAQFQVYPPPTAATNSAQMYSAPQTTSPAKSDSAKPDATKAYKSEMDSLYDELKQKSANNEKLPLDKYVKSNDSKPRTLDTIFEESNSDEEIEDFTTDADEHNKQE